jgi:hypothetical protein
VPPSANEMREHLAYEVHLLVWAAMRFRTAKSKDKMVFQDGVLLHARNLLEFTKPEQRPRRGWWIVDVGAPMPQKTKDYDAWNAFINANATHLGDLRLQSVPWPVAKDEERLVELSRFALARVRAGLPASTADPLISVLLEVTQRGLDYLDDPTAARIKQLADLVG